MRAVGASGHDIRRIYLRSAAILGLLGAVIGVVLGIGLAYLLVGLFARLFFGVSPGFAIDWPIAAASALAGIAGAVLDRVAHGPATAAHARSGGARQQGPGIRVRRQPARPRAAALRAGPPPPVRVGVRNVARQKGRSATTIVQIALAVATTLGLVSFAQAVSGITDRNWNVLAYDITLGAQPGGHGYGPAVVSAVRAQPGVTGVDATDTSQMTYRGQTLYAFGVAAPRSSTTRSPPAAG